MDFGVILRQNVLVLHFAIGPPLPAKEICTQNGRAMNE